MKNLLIQYEGGGYSGCFWEWNFAYYDGEGVFHNIFASGRDGCKDHEAMQKRIKDIDEDMKRYHRSNPDYYFYDTTDKTSLLEFARETNEGLVIGVAKWFSENTDITILAPCSICGDEQDASEYISEGETGCGGIATKMTMMVCEDCHSEHTCAYCGEFFDEVNSETFPKCEDGFCMYCHEAKHCSC